MAKRVLLIDDDADTRRLVRHMLDGAGYDVRELPSADSLETSVAEFRPDLVLSDVLMPGRDGVDVCRAMQPGTCAHPAPVVLMSAKDFEGDKRQALDAGASGYLSKPVRAEELLLVVRETVNTTVSVRIWGCRGSIPAPERAMGRYGGNTPCVEVMLPGRHRLIFDAGTGIRVLGNHLVGQSPQRLALFLTHYHWDHIQGLPFFKPLYVGGNEVHLHGPASSQEALVETIEVQMGGEFFPVSIDTFRAGLKFVHLHEQTFEAYGARISTLYTFHPNRTLAYRVEYGGRSVVFAPDNELVPENVTPELSGEPLRMARFAAGADLLIHDCQYSRALYESRRGWGHSCGVCLAHVVAAAGPKRTLLFHHEPDHDDAAVEAIHEEFRRTLQELGVEVESEPAREGAIVEL